MGTAFSAILDALWTAIVGTATTSNGVTTYSGGVINTILGSPVLMIGIGIWFAGGAIGLAYRLIRG